MAEEKSDVVVNDIIESPIIDDDIFYRYMNENEHLLYEGEGLNIDDIIDWDEIKAIEEEFLKTNAQLSDKENFITNEDTNCNGCERESSAFDENDIEELFKNYRIIFIDDNILYISDEGGIKTFAIVPRILVSGNYPRNLLVGNEFKKYILDLFRRNIKTGESSSGNKDYNNIFKYISPDLFKQIVNTNINNKLIRFKIRKGKVTWYHLLVPPVFDKVNNKLIQYDTRPFTTNLITYMKNHFIMLPSELIDNQSFRELSSGHLKVLIKLYRYSFPEIFGGVDFNIIYKESQRLNIVDTLYKDIHIDRAEFLSVLCDLENLGLIHWVDITVSIERIEFEEVTRYTPNKVQASIGENLTFKHISVIRLSIL
jgi:hypothetical protein